MKHPFFEYQLGQLYNACTQFRDAMPRMASAATDFGLQTLCMTYYQQAKWSSDKFKSRAKDFKVCKSMVALKDDATEAKIPKRPKLISDLELSFGINRMKRHLISLFTEMSLHAKAYQLDDDLDLMKSLRLKIGEENKEVLHAVHEFAKNEKESELIDTWLKEKTVQLILLEYVLLGFISDLYDQTMNDRLNDELKECMDQSQEAMSTLENYIQSFMREEEKIAKHPFAHALKDEWNEAIDRTGKSAACASALLHVLDALLAYYEVLHAVSYERGEKKLTDIFRQFAEVQNVQKKKILQLIKDLDEQSDAH